MNTLYLFRPGKLAGTRERWKFTVDDHQNIVAEELMPEELPPIKTTAIRDASGKLVVSSISDTDRRILGFFSPSTPCWFQGCEELRKQYQVEEGALDANCPDCQKGAIIRKYQDLVKKHESAEKNHPDSA
jgi:hypothetical protein